MISARLKGPGDVWLLGPVRGLASELATVSESLRAHPPSAVGLGTSPDEMKGLLEYFVLSTAEPVVPLTTAERSEVRGLVRFGEVRVPNPVFVELIRWGRDANLPVEALDPTEERTASLFADHIGYLELVRRTVRERRVSKAPPTPASADEYALAWDREVAGGRGSRSFATARDRYFVRGARRLVDVQRSVALVVDRERFDRVRTLYESPDQERLDPD